MLPSLVYVTNCNKPTQWSATIWSENFKALAGNFVQNKTKQNDFNFLVTVSIVQSLRKQYQVMYQASFEFATFAICAF